MKITVETIVNARPTQVWQVFNNPEEIVQWNTPHESWHTTRSAVDLREGGRFSARMEAKDGSAGFDFEGTYTRVVPNQVIDYRMSDGREVNVQFIEQADGVLVRETFDAESQNPVEMQRDFGRHVEQRP
jgi:uncharacterized protein YndB with AHSA1/START domain